MTMCTETPKNPPGKGGSQTGSPGSVVRGKVRTPAVSPKSASQGTGYLVKHSGRQAHKEWGPVPLQSAIEKGSKEQAL